LKELELSDGSWIEVSWYRVPDDGACDGEGRTTKLAPVMWHVDRAKTAAGGAKTLTTGEIVGLPIIYRHSGFE